MKNGIKKIKKEQEPYLAGRIEKYEKNREMEGEDAVDSKGSFISEKFSRLCTYIDDVTIIHCFS